MRFRAWAPGRSPGRIGQAGWQKEWETGGKGVGGRRRPKQRAKPVF